MAKNFCWQVTDINLVSTFRVHSFLLQNGAIKSMKEFPQVLPYLYRIQVARHILKMPINFPVLNNKKSRSAQLPKIQKNMFEF